jgi:hypothetical protein
MLLTLEILKDVCARLQKARIEYMLTGSSELPEGCLRERHVP